jgi:hypothetical protein
VGETIETCSLDCGSRTLETTFVGGNGSDGNMFKVQTLRDIAITGFTIHNTAAGTITVKIFEKSGDYVGFELDSAAWNLIHEETLTGSGQGSPTALSNLDSPVFISGGATHSFYIRSTGGMRYTNGGTEGTLFVENTDLSFYEGKGVSGEFGGTFSPRVWNGIIQYGTVSSLSPPSPSPTANPSKAPSVSPSKDPSVSPSKVPCVPPFVYRTPPVLLM